MCLHFHFLIRTLLSQWELLLTGTQALAGLYEFLHWWVWWDLRRCVWILPPADCNSLLLAPGPQTCGIKDGVKKMRARIAGKHGSYTLQCDVIKSDMFSGVRCGQPTRIDNAVSLERALGLRSIEIDLPQLYDWWSPFRLNCRVLDWTCTLGTRYWNWLLCAALSSSQVGNWVTKHTMRGIDGLCDCYTVCVRFS